MNAIERSAATHAHNGQTVAEWSKNVRISSFVFDIPGNIII